MADLEIGAKTFTVLPVAATRTDGSYWMRVPHPHGEAREFEDITAEATDGVEKADHGYRGRILGPIVVMFVAASEDALVTAYKTLLTAVEAKPDGITITMPYGLSYTSCYIQPGSPMPIGPREADETGKRYQVVEMTFSQERE
jgi:hypothetical protein